MWPSSTSSRMARSASHPCSVSGGASPRIRRIAEWTATSPELEMNERPERSSNSFRVPASYSPRMVSMTPSNVAPSSSPSSATTVMGVVPSTCSTVVCNAIYRFSSGWPASERVRVSMLPPPSRGR